MAAEQLYIFEAESPGHMPAGLTLHTVGPLIKNATDMEIIHRLIHFNVPCRIALAESAYVCIAVHPGIGEDAGFLDEPSIKPYGPLFYGANKMPHLATAIYRGYKNQGRVHYEPMNENSTLSLIKGNVDIIAVIGQPGTGKSTLMQKLLRQLTLKFSLDTGVLGLTVAQYIEKITQAPGPQHKAPEELAYRKHNFINFIHLLDDAVKELDYLFGCASENADTGLINEILSLKNSLLLKGDKSAPGHKDLLKAIYAIPQNSRMFDDNGQYILLEVLHKLKAAAAAQNCNDEILQLEALASSKPDGQWFNTAAALKVKLFHRFLPGGLQYISEQDKNAVARLFDKTLNSYDKNHGKKTVMEALGAEMEKALSNSHMAGYFSEFMTDCHAFCGNTLFIDLDNCLNEQSLIHQMKKAEKIVVFGSYLKGLFELMVRGANALQLEDGRQRIYYLPVNYNQSPELAGFISSSFYEPMGVPPVKPLKPAEPGLYPFRYITSGKILPHVQECIQKGYSVAVISMEPMPKVLKRLPAAVATGPPEQFANKVFDAVFILEAAAFTPDGLCGALSRCLKMAYVCGNPNNIDGSLPLKHFYYICSGDDAIGKLY